MKRSGPPKRNASIKRKASMGRGGKPLTRASTKTVDEQIERSAMRRKMIEDGRGCEVCPVLAGFGVVTHCAHRIEGLHERRKASSGGSKLNPANLVPSCNWGNDFIEDHPRALRDHTGDRLVVREGDPEFDALGAKAWRDRQVIR